MRTATGLILLAIGAILTFAVTANAWFINVHVAGVVIMLTGVASLAMPRRSYSWVNQKVVQRSRRTGRPANGTRYPPYVLINPAARTRPRRRPAGRRAGPSIPADPTVRAVMTPGDVPEGDGTVLSQDTEVIEQLRDD